MPDLKPTVPECEKHLDTYIAWLDNQKYCMKCGKMIRTFADESKIKRTHDEGT